MKRKRQKKEKMKIDGIDTDKINDVADTVDAIQEKMSKEEKKFKMVKLTMIGMFGIMIVLFIYLFWNLDIRQEIAMEELGIERAGIYDMIIQLDNRIDELEQKNAIYLQIICENFNDTICRNKEN